MKKLSPEFRVGAIAIIIIVLFIWLFNFLKGHNLLSNYDHYSAKYDNVAGLVASSPVEISGLKAGIVNNVKLLNDGSGMIEVLFSIDKGYLIPDNSIAEITSASLIAGMKINLMPGDSKTFLESGDKIEGRVAVSILDKFDNSLNPVMTETKLLVKNLDTLISKFNLLFSPEFSSNIAQSADNLKSASGDFRILLNNNSENLTELIKNLNLAAQILEKNSSQIDSTINAVNKITTAISEAEIESTIDSLKTSIDKSIVLLHKLNTGEGSAGKFLNDDSLYLNLSNSLNSLDLLLKDIEAYPEKYVHFSLFGKKKE